jgi:hypothetical protein
MQKALFYIKTFPPYNCNSGYLPASSNLKKARYGPESVDYLHVFSVAGALLSSCIIVHERALYNRG